MKKETIEEYLKRGGVVNKLDYVEPVVPREIVKVTQQKQMIFDLGYGELLYGERQKGRRKAVIKDKLLKSQLPQDMIQRIMERINERK